MCKTRDLSQFWSFRILVFAIVAYTTKPMSVIMHGLIGFIALLCVAWIFMLARGELRTIEYNIRHVATRNTPLIIFCLWYMAGVVINIYFRGGIGGVEDWRLNMGPILLLFSIFFAFAFLHFAGIHDREYDV